jgi:hypothetical protein
MYPFASNIPTRQTTEAADCGPAAVSVGAVRPIGFSRRQTFTSLYIYIYIYSICMWPPNRYIAVRIQQPRPRPCHTRAHSFLQPAGHHKTQTDSQTPYPNGPQSIHDTYPDAEAYADAVFHIRAEPQSADMRMSRCSWYRVAHVTLHARGICDTAKSSRRS